MIKRWLIALSVLFPALLAAQNAPMADLNSLRMSASAYTDSMINSAAGGIRFELRQAVPNRGIFSSSISLVEDRKSLRTGRGFARWEGFGNEGTTSRATAGSL